MSSQRTHITRQGNATLRHRCTGCGGCCQGVRIPVYNDQERAKVERAAAHLDIPDPIQDDALRMSKGRCVFLADDNRCRIHSSLGPSAKPIPCLQFPLIAIKAQSAPNTGSEFRIGIDPASYGAWQSWREGPPLPDGPIVAASPPAPGGQDRVEAQLVAMCEDPQASVPGLLSVLTREPAPRGVLPPGFAKRWASHLSSIDFEPFLTNEGVGPNLRAALKPVTASACKWASGPLPWPDRLSSNDEAWAIEAIRRTIFLRLLPQIPNVSAAALLLLGGVVAAAWTDPRPEPFNRAITGWQRALRFSLFWQTLASDRETMVWLGTGQRPNSAGAAS
ncbi:MAG: hypothetical protein EA397_06130 [Deltaproteobacteria bacterium]|nr:MAG: hypothetical protein EA397_06130 [Deltaproteobacteria bacterium]